MLALPPDVRTPQEKRFLTIIDHKENERLQDAAGNHCRAERAARIATEAARGHQNMDAWDTAARVEMDFAVLHEVDLLPGRAGAHVFRESLARYIDAVLVEALRRLRREQPREHDVLTLRYIQYALTQEQVATMLGLSARTIRTVDRRVRYRLRDFCDAAERRRDLQPVTGPICPW